MKTGQMIIQYTCYAVIAVAMLLIVGSVGFFLALFAIDEPIVTGIVIAIMGLAVFTMRKSL